MRVGGILFAYFYDFSIGLWICSESVAFVFSILSASFLLSSTLFYACRPSPYKPTIVIGYQRKQYHKLVCVGNKFKTSNNLIHKFRKAKRHELGYR